MTSVVRAEASEGAPGAAPPRADLARERTAAVALFLLGLDVSASNGLSTGLFVAVTLIPVWGPALRRYRGATTLLVLGAAALAAGWVLALSDSTHDVDPKVAVQTSLQLVTAFAGIGLILWARQVLPVPRIAIVYGLGLLVSALAKTRGSDNAWKYELAVPITMIVLGYVTSRSRWLQVATLMGLAAVGVLADHRSYVGFCLAVVAVVVWQGRPVRGRRVGPGWQVALLGVFAFGVYRLGTSLLLSGSLGYNLQQRSISQIRDGGSLILGGRPEWHATLKLMQANLNGFGVGSIPTARDVVLAERGLVSVGLQTKNGYVYNYMFGGTFRLHSVVADLWSNLGVAGVVLALAIGLALLLSLSSAMADRQASALVVFLALNSLWNLAFGPLYSSLPELIPALGLVLLVRPPRAAAAGRPASGTRRVQPSARAADPTLGAKDPAQDVEDRPLVVAHGPQGEPRERVDTERGGGGGGEAR